MNLDFESWLNEEAERLEDSSLKHVRNWIKIQESEKQMPISVLFRFFTAAIQKAGFKISSKTTWNISSFTIITEKEKIMVSKATATETFISIQHNYFSEIYIIFYTSFETFRYKLNSIQIDTVDTAEKAERFIGNFLYTIDPVFLTQKTLDFLETQRGMFTGNSTGIL